MTNPTINEYFAKKNEALDKDIEKLNRSADRHNKINDIVENYSARMKHNTFSQVVAFIPRSLLLVNEVIHLRRCKRLHAREKALDLAKEAMIQHVSENSN